MRRREEDGILLIFGRWRRARRRRFDAPSRHCEEQSDEAIHFSAC
jgi:hypothetical protein